MSSDRNPIIRIENLGKKYSLPHENHDIVRYRRMSEDLVNALKRPFRRASRDGDRHCDEEFWALRNISFEVNQGDVVGIIGRNGGGKSTLLKILSRITDPTEGRVRLQGRVASLLEVGTGFHAELTGRENVFLNGAILGMTRAEIRRKFDEIVAFAGVERFLDLPIKRYSSGMYVRLAFSVAAHLEPEILVVDEVLAVGDAEFQDKCLGKMSEAAKGGRTILFVSHNMAAVSSLTTRAVLLDLGQMVFSGTTSEAIQHYSQIGGHVIGKRSPFGRGLHTALLDARLIDEAGTITRLYIPGQPLRLEVELETDGTSRLSLEAFLRDYARHNVALGSLQQFHGITLPKRPGRYRTVVEFEPLWLASGSYSFDLATSVVNLDWDHYVDSALEFEVPCSNPGAQTWDFKQSLGYGSVAVRCARPPSFSQL